MEINNEIMEIVSFEKRTFEEMPTAWGEEGRTMDGQSCSLPETAYQPEDIADPP